MQLHLSTWAEVEAQLEHSDGIIIPIGSTEQHGPNGLIGTDAICADGIAQRVGEAAGALVAPPISVGIAQHHMAFAGSMTLTPKTLIAVIAEMIEGLAVHGFRRFYMINGHGGNSATIAAAFQEIHSRRSLQGGGARLETRVRNWWEGARLKELAKQLYGSRDGQHATASEVAVTQFLYPDHIKQVPISPEVAPAYRPWGDAQSYRDQFPDGRIGSAPGLASPEAGAKLVECAVTELVADYREFVGG